MRRENAALRTALPFLIVGIALTAGVLGMFAIALSCGTVDRLTRLNGNGGVLDFAPMVLFPGLALLGAALIFAGVALLRLRPGARSFALALAWLMIVLSAAYGIGELISMQWRGPLVALVLVFQWSRCVVALRSREARVDAASGLQPAPSSRQ